MADAGFANGVTGEKDAVDKDGKPIYQAIDTKFLIPEMVKVIQEQQSTIEKQHEQIEKQQKQIDKLEKLIKKKLK
jgi:2C-methyl-D-erythritol 2,4-cyclodiphosphate synthase